MCELCKQRFGNVLASLAPFFLLVFGMFAHAESDVINIALLHLNDAYQTQPVDKGARGGLARVATLKKRIQAESPDALLILSGDTLSPSVVSSLFQGRQMIAAWNAAGLDLAVFGNHEFDFGPEVLKARVGESRFAWLAANVVDGATQRPFAGAERYVVKGINGVRVGFFGVLTPATREISRPGTSVAFLDPIDTGRKIVAELRAKGVKTIVALTHLSMPEDRAFAASVPVDLILGGHEHGFMQAVVKGTPIFKMGSDARILGRYDLSLSKSDGSLLGMDFTAIPVTADIPDDQVTLAATADYERQASASLDQPVGSSSVVLDASQTGSRSRETNLGNFIADAFRQATGADAVLFNGGSIRSNTTYGPGTISRRDVVSILPFENPIVKVAVSGMQLREALENGLSRIAEDKESGRFPQISGMTVRYDPRLPAGSRVVEAKIAGQPLNDEQTYSLASNTYVLGGGDGYDMFKSVKYLITLEDADVATAIAIRALANGEISPKVEGRIVDVLQTRQ